MSLYLLKLDFDGNIISYEVANFDENSKTQDYFNLKYYITTRGIFFFNKGRRDCVIDMNFKFKSILDHNVIHRKLKAILRNDSLKELGI
jgi:hypothetical protein